MSIITARQHSTQKLMCELIATDEKPLFIQKSEDIPLVRQGLSQSIPQNVINLNNTDHI